MKNVCLTLSLIFVAFMGFALGGILKPACASGYITKQCDSMLSNGTEYWAHLKQSATVMESSNQFVVTIGDKTLISPRLTPVDGGGMGGHDGPVMYFKDAKGFAVMGEGTPVLVMLNCTVRM